MVKKKLNFSIVNKAVQTPRENTSTTKVQITDIKNTEAGGAIYVENGFLYYKSPSGTVSLIASN